MITYDPLYPNWYFSYVEIPKLKEIQLELLSLKYSKIISYQKSPFYYNVLKEDIVDCPELFEYLKSKELFGKFKRLLFSTNGPTQDVTHVDGYNPLTRNHFSLNIPLIDCENSYTVFYDYKGKHLIYNQDTYNFFAWMTLDKVKELTKVECVKPMLVNTTILHRGIMEKKSRTIVGIRFSSPLTIEEIKRLGIKNPLVQEDF